MPCSCAAPPGTTAGGCRGGHRLRCDRPRRGDRAHAHGVHDVAVLTNRRTRPVAAPIHAAQMIQFDHDDGPYLTEVITDDGACRWRRSWPRATSSSTARCRTRTRPLLYLKTEDLAAFRPGQPHRRRLVRRGHGLRLGAPDALRGPDVHGRRQHQLLRRRPQPVLPVELGDAGRSARRCSPFLPTYGRSGRLGGR